MTSLNQHRKFDELESQLNEAECIILDLRAELNQAQEELVEVKQRKLPCTSLKEYTELRNMTAKDTCTDNELPRSSLNSVPHFSTFGSNDSCLDWSTLDKNCCSPVKEHIKFTPECDVISGDNHLISDQIKETDLSRNGCTEIICAIETSLVQEKFPVGERSNPSNNSANIENVKNDVVSTSVLEEKVQHGNIGAVSIVRRSLRKRKLKCWDDVLTACELHQSYLPKKPHSAFPHLSLHNASQAKSGDDHFQAEDGIKTEESAECPRKELRRTEGIPENMKLINVLVKQEDV